MLIVIATMSALGYQSSANSDMQNELVRKAYELLENAEVMEVRAGHLLIVGGEAAGMLWKNVKVEDITIGEPFTVRWSARAPLLAGEEVVGQIFVEGRQFGLHSDANPGMSRRGWYGNGNCDRSQAYGSQYGDMHGHGKHGQRGHGKQGLHVAEFDDS